MQRILVGLALALVGPVALGGCLDGEIHATSAHFTSAGSYEAALAAGAKAPDPRLGEGERPIALEAPDLDAEWGKGRYTLAKLQWAVWAWSGPTPDNPRQQFAQVTLSLDTFGLRAESGGAPREVLRAPAEHFLQNVTTLSKAERDRVVDALMTGTSDVRAEDLDARPAWDQAGGLDALRPAGDWTGYDLESNGSYAGQPGATWRFRFAYDVAEVEDGGGQAFVWPTDEVWVFFYWCKPRSDAEAYDAVVEVLADTAIDVPPPGALEWSNGTADSSC